MKYDALIMLKIINTNVELIKTFENSYEMKTEGEYEVSDRERLLSVANNIDIVKK